MPLFALSLILQVAFVLHIVKTGRNTTWIWIVVMLPFAGAVAYLIVELLPELLGTRSGRKAIRKVDSVINPDRTLKQAANQYAVADTVENSRRLAEECLDKQRFDEAQSLYEKCLKGLYEHDAVLLHGLARAQYGSGNFADVIHTLDRLKQHNPDYRDADAHLLYAKAMDAQNKYQEALHEYEVLARYYPGPEAKCRYALLLQKQGREKDAAALFHEVVTAAKHSGRHYRELHKEWIDMAKKNTSSS